MGFSGNFSYRRPFAVPTIIFLNIVVYSIWLGATGDEAQFMADNFLVSGTALSEGRYWVLLTAVFSHNLFLHLLLNMYVLMSFGGLLERVLGSWSFLRFYLVAGMISSLAHVLVSTYIMDSPNLQALGASGSIAGLILVFSLMFPKEKILLFGLIPLPALFGALAFIGLDLWGLVEQAGGGGLPIGHGAHLGGSFTGVAYYFLFIRKAWSIGRELDPDLTESMENN